MLHVIDCVAPENIHTSPTLPTPHPHRRDWKFQGCWRPQKFITVYEAKLKFQRGGEGYFLELHMAVFYLLPHQVYRKFLVASWVVELCLLLRMNLYF